MFSLLCTSGKKVPHRPVEVKISDNGAHYAVINWTIPSIAYTPETYVVGYQETSSSVYVYTKTLRSGEDINAVNQTFGVRLWDLEPGSRYCYVVVSRNLGNSYRSKEKCFDTKTLGKYYLSK